MMICPAYAASYAIAPIPDWVQAVDAPQQLSINPESASAMLLYDKQILTGARHVNFTHEVSQALTMVGVSDISEIDISFNPAYQTLNLHRVAVIHQGQVRDLTASVPVRVIQREESLSDRVQDGVSTALISIPNVQVGDRVELAYSVDGVNPVFGQRHFGIVGINSSRYIEKQSVRIIAPASQPLVVQPFRQSQPIAASKKGANLEYRYDQQHIDAVVLEEDSPVWDAGYSWISYSAYPDWKSVIDWGMKLYQPASSQHPKFEALYQDLAKQAKTPAQFVALALAFSQQQIRYLGLEFGENSHRPHDPELVLERRFGDCKDKTLLLVSLLRRHGLEAAPAIVSTNMRDGMRYVTPTLSLFNHVITRVKLADQTYWLDATRQYQNSPVDKIGQLDYGYALVLAPQQVGLERMYPQANIEKSLELDEHHYIKSFDQPVEVELTTKYYGNEAEYFRYQMNNQSIRKLSQDYLAYFTQAYPSAELAQPVRFEDDLQRNIMTMKESYRITDYWKTSNRYRSSPVYLLGFMNAVNRPKMTQRKTTLQLSPPRLLTSRVYIHYPEPVPLMNLADPTEITAPGLSYKAMDRYQDNVYMHQAELKIERPWIEAEQVQEMASQYKKIRQLWEFNLTFPNDYGQHERKLLLNEYRLKAAE